MSRQAQALQRRPGRLPFALLWQPRGSGRPACEAERLELCEVSDFLTIASDAKKGLGDFYLVNPQSKPVKVARAAIPSPWLVAMAIVALVVIMS